MQIFFIPHEKLRNGYIYGQKERDMTTFEIFILCLGGGGILSILSMALTIGRGFGKIDQRLENIEHKIEKLDGKIEKLESTIGTMAIQLGKLETRVEERTLRVIHGSKVDDGN
jgi:hypothetical protein